MRYFVSFGILIGISFAVLGIGRYNIGYADILSALGHLVGFKSELGDRILFVILEVRLPRVILAIFVGAALGMVGASFQSIFRNPLASPDILGVSSGAGFGAALALLLGLNIYFLTLFAFVFGILTLILTFIIARDSNNRIMIILSGIIISALFQSLIALLKYIADPQDTLPAITYWLLGSLAVSDIWQLVFCCAGMSAGGIVLFIYRWKHNLLMLDDIEAKSLGLNIARIRIVLIFASTLMVSCAVSICGIIGWVGLIIPHIARIISSSNTAIVIPLSVFIGAIFMVAIDTIARSVSSEEIPISILSAIIGAGFFLSILYKSKGNIRL